MQSNGSITKVARRGRVKDAPRVEPWMPAEWAPVDAAAIQAVAAGRANEDQQRRAMRFIVDRLCGTYDLSYRSEHPNDTSFAEGKRFVGLQIVKFINLSLAMLRGKQTEQGAAAPSREETA